MAILTELAIALSESVRVLGPVLKSPDLRQKIPGSFQRLSTSLIGHWVKNLLRNVSGFGHNHRGSMTIDDFCSSLAQLPSRAAA
jgi:hypothetical protein